jgi:hypothetical protein
MPSKILSILIKGSWPRLVKSRSHVYISSFSRSSVLPVQFSLPLHPQPVYNCTVPTELLVPEWRAKKSLNKPNCVASIFKLISITRPWLSPNKSLESRKGVYNKAYVIYFTWETKIKRCRINLQDANLKSRMWVVKAPFSGSFCQLCPHQQNSQLHESDPAPIKCKKKMHWFVFSAGYRVKIWKITHPKSFHTASVSQ